MRSEVNTSHELIKHASTSKLAMIDNSNKSKAKKRPSFNFSKENFVYLKQKDILKEFEFYERIGQGNLFC